MLDIYEHLNALDPRLLEPGRKRKSGH